MKLWIDDMREPPGRDWVWVKTSEDALAYIRTGQVEFVAFDHDLGGDDTAYRVAVEIEQRAAQGAMPPGWGIHSQNPVGAERIRCALLSAEMNWKRRLKERA